MYDLWTRLKIIGSIRRAKNVPESPGGTSETSLVAIGGFRAPDNSLVLWGFELGPIIYTQEVPEPSQTGLLGLAAAVFLIMRCSIRRQAWFTSRSAQCTQARKKANSYQ
jgi:hypothetical protein